MSNINKNNPPENISFLEWLNGAIKFDHNLVLDEQSKGIALKLFGSLKLNKGYKPEQKFKCFKILLANFLDHPKLPVSISLDKKDWTKTKLLDKSYYTVELVHILYTKKLIDMAKGFYTEEQSRLTRIWATEKLLEHFHESNPHVDAIIHPRALVELRGMNDNELIDYKETHFTYRIRKILARTNEVNRSAIIRFQEWRLKANLIAVFKGKFSQYGRLHTKGYRHYQGFNKNERDEITINGDKVVELDYSALHPMLLYAAEGIQYHDAPYLAVEKDPAAKKFVKYVLICMINANDFNKAQKAANYWLYRKKNYKEKQALAQIGITRARPIMDKILEVHKPIAHYLCQDNLTGLRLMNKDSRIAIDIVSYFSSRNIPILCIHDSFIVQQQHENELRKVMLKTYRKHTRIPDKKPKGFTCGIKRGI